MKVDISNTTLPEGVTIQDIETFVELYRDHCEVSGGQNTSQSHL